MMAGEIDTVKEIGDTIYRKWRYPDRDDYWYETYFVERKTPKFVFVRGFMESHTIRLKRGVLERFGTTFSMTHGAVFCVDMPEEYRRTTIGYLMDKEPREVLGLGEQFTGEDLRRNYRELAFKYHPDRNPGDREAEEKFMQVNAAYERLRDPHTLGVIMEFMRGQNGKGSKGRDRGDGDPRPEGAGG